jgi:hypothetical protein
MARWQALFSFHVLCLHASFMKAPYHADKWHPKDLLAISIAARDRLTTVYIIIIENKNLSCLNEAVTVLSMDYETVTEGLLNTRVYLLKLDIY